MGFLSNLVQFLFATSAVVDNVVDTGNKRACTNPAVRKEWRALTKVEKADWIRSVKCLASLPHDPAIAATVKPTDPPYKLPPQNTSASYYDDLSYIHMDLSTQTHYEGIWLPWHRLYLQGFEDKLKELCGFQGTLPYWDWTIDAPDFEHASIWQESDLDSGLGGWGDPTQGYKVLDGGFAYNFTLSYPAPHSLHREFTLQPYIGLNPEIFPLPDMAANETITAEEMEKMIAGFNGDFRGMSMFFDRDQGPRTAVHRLVGGDSGGNCPPGVEIKDCTRNPAMTPNDPIFWLIHEYMGKVWWDWQNYNVSANFWSYSANTTYDPNGTNVPVNTDLDYLMPTDGFYPQATVRDVMNITGGYLCYIYE